MNAKTAVRWSKAETDHLEMIVGDFPFPILCHNYNVWAGKNGYTLRSRGAIQDKIGRLKTSRIVVGEWVRLTDVSKFLDVSKQTLMKWSGLGILPITRIGDSRNHWHYVKRKDIVQLANQNPQLIGGRNYNDLAMLLEDQDLARSISEDYPRQKPKKRRVRCIEGGLIYESVAEAARRHHVSRRRIHQSMKTGERAGGFHWEKCA